MLENLELNTKPISKCRTANINSLKSSTKDKINHNMNMVRFLFSEKIIQEIIVSIELLILKYETPYRKKLNRDWNLRKYISENLRKKKPLWDYMVWKDIIENIHSPWKREDILANIWLDIIFIWYQKEKRDFFIEIFYYKFIEYSRKQINPRNFDRLIRKLKQQKAIRKWN